MMRGLLPLMALCLIVWVFWMTKEWLTKKKKEGKDE